MKLFIHSAAGLLLALFLTGCTRSYPCNDSQIQPVFIGFKNADIDTLILRKFKPDTNYRTLVDTFVVKYGVSGYYRSSHDTTTVFVQEDQNGIKAGYDWQLVVPAKHRFVLIADIMGEQNTGECSRGIFSMDPWSCQCSNELFSARVDNKLVDFSGAYFGNYRITIK